MSNENAVETERLPPLPEAALTVAQRTAAAALVAGRRGALFGPFVPLLRSPQLLDRAQRLGEYLRYESGVPVRLRELAILLTARHYRQAYEWHVHAPAASQAGLAASLIDAIGTGKPPAAMTAEEATVYEFCGQLLQAHTVDDPTYAAALALLGEAGVVELCGICGYYGLLALVMNVARTALPAGARAPW